MVTAPLCRNHFGISRLTFLKSWSLFIKVVQYYINFELSLVFGTSNLLDSVCKVTNYFIFHPVLSLVLPDLLKWFTRNESLDGELYHCDTCGHDNHQKAHKQLMIAQYPDVSRLVQSTTYSSRPHNKRFSDFI